ncbi:MAG: hypothetical protein ACREN1_01725, partial [Candidatus Dormibacteria bacterium]
PDAALAFPPTAGRRAAGEPPGRRGPPRTVPITLRGQLYLQLVEEVYRPVRVRAQRPCVTCGVIFMPTRRGHVHCSDRCRLRRHRASPGDAA